MEDEKIVNVKNQCQTKNETEKENMKEEEADVNTVVKSEYMEVDNVEVKKEEEMSDRERSLQKTVFKLEKKIRKKKERIKAEKKKVRTLEQEVEELRSRLQFYEATEQQEVGDRDGADPGSRKLGTSCEPPLT